MMRRNCYKLEEVNVEHESWVNRGAREVAHFN
jgi:hypothetical protein